MGVLSSLQNLPEKTKQIALGSVSVIAGIAILIGYFHSGPSALSYAKAERAIAQWHASPSDEALYTSMIRAIRDVPALEEKYEASIAQKLFDIEKVEEGLVFANRALSRVKGEAPLHATFAKTSLLIESGKFQEALEQAVALKEQMGPSYLSEIKGGSLLYAHNLLRIACLQQELKNRPGEKAAWEELETLLSSQSVLAERLSLPFADKDVSLSQYIAERKKGL